MLHALSRTESTPRLRSVIAARPLTASALAFLVAALVLRSAWFGNPLAGYDEQFYLLVGQRMWEGAVPYVDIWDRKPIGLFVIYAVAARFGDGVLAYQVMAAGAASATAFVILLHIRPHYGTVTGVICGMLYLLWLGVMGGEAGQSPIFYNPLIATAALLVLRAVPDMAARRGMATGALAMLLCGVALTIKTTAIFESCFLGMTLVWGLWRAGVTLPRMACSTALLMAAGALPFLIAIAAYAAMGHLDAFWFANATSAALRSGGWAPIYLKALVLTVAALSPLALFAAAGQRYVVDDAKPVAWERRFLIGWIGIATIGFGAVGFFYHHYALPLLVPLVIAAAPFMCHARLRWTALILVSLFPLAQSVVRARLITADDSADIARIASVIPSQVRSGCVFVYGGPPMLYSLHHACMVTRFGFPDHLYVAEEAPAIGTDPVAEVAAALARRPLVIITQTDLVGQNRTPGTDALVDRVLARDYRLIGARDYRYFEEGPRRLYLWERRVQPTAR